MDFDQFKRACETKGVPVSQDKFSYPYLRGKCGPLSPMLTDPLSVSAQKQPSAARSVLAELNDWCGGIEAEPASIRAWEMYVHSYKLVCKSYGEKGHAGMALRASTGTAVELNSLIAYPDRQGHGTDLMNKLCEVADKHGVDVWLDAAPYGSNRAQISLKKLKRFYRRFRFVSLDGPRAEWLCGYHAWDDSPMANVMLRAPKPRSEPPIADDAVGTAPDGDVAVPTQAQPHIEAKRYPRRQSEGTETR